MRCGGGDGVWEGGSRLGVACPISDDVVVAGFPCSSKACGGKREGAGDGGRCSGTPGGRRSETFGKLKGRSRCGM